LAGLVVLEDRPAIEPGELDGARHDRGEHRFEVEGGADGPAYLAERRQLLHRARQVARARLQLAKETGVLDSDYGLVREGVHELDLRGRERLHLAPPAYDHTDGGVVSEHRDAHDRPIAHDLLNRAAPLTVLGDAEDILEMDQPPLEKDSARDHASIRS